MEACSKLAQQLRQKSLEHEWLTRMRLRMVMVGLRLRALLLQMPYKQQAQ